MYAYDDAATARFLSRDPLASLTGEPYTYVADNPLDDADPAGLAGMAGCVDDVNPLAQCLPGWTVLQGVAKAAGEVVAAVCALAGALHGLLSGGGEAGPNYWNFVHPAPPGLLNGRPIDVPPNARPKRVLDDSLRLQRYFDSMGRTITPEDPGPAGPNFKCGRYCKALIAGTIGGAAYLLSQGYTNTEGPADRPGGPQ